MFLNVIILTLISQVYSAYYTHKNGNNTILRDLYFDPSNHLEADCITDKAQGYYSYFGRRNKNYQMSFLGKECNSWESIRIYYEKLMDSYRMENNSSQRDKIEKLDFSTVEWGISGYWRHNECRNVRLSNNHPFYKAKGGMSNIGNEKYRAGWNFGPWCYVNIDYNILKNEPLETKINNSWYLNTSVEVNVYPMACFPICTEKQEKRIDNFKSKKQKRKTNMIFNRKAINNINKHFFKSFYFGMMQYYQRTSDRVHASDDFITFYKMSMWGGFLTIIFTIFIVYFCYRLDKYEEQLEKGGILDEEVDDLDKFFEFKKDDDIEEEKENLRNTLLKCQGIQVRRIAKSANNNFTLKKL
uniref:Kringle domain-containing protein n=1 Tax=Strongyloides venezuelensis TaxID=75913 RepID=A0A0K0F6B7_STRVS